jgi:hypothetical protein
MITITPEQRRAIEEAGEGPLRIEDPETHEVYVVIKEEDYRRLRTAETRDLTESSGEFYPARAYQAIDRAFAEGWSDPRMAEYDDYEKHRS